MENDEKRETYMLCINDVVGKMGYIRNNWTAIIKDKSKRTSADYLSL